MADLKLYFDDMFKVDWSDADLIYVTNLCFPEEMNDRLADHLEKLKVGTKITTIKKLPDRPYLKL